MKEFVKCLMAALVAIIAATANAAWTFDPTGGTLDDGKFEYVGTVTDGVVTFHVTRVTGNENNQLTINAQYGYFNDPTPFQGGGGEFLIDFTEIYDAQKTTRYYAVNFGYFSVNSDKPSANYLLTPYRDRLTEFIAPHCTGLSGNGCFGYCTGLTNVVLSQEFSSFADRSFLNCSALIDLTPMEFGKVTRLSIGCFAGCSKLPGELSFPKCTSSGGSMFSNCTLIDNISLPELKDISEADFSGCSNLKNLELSPGVRYIGTGAFRDCTSLPGDFFRTLLDKDIEQLGNGNYISGTKECFVGCSSLDGAIDWNFPNLKTRQITENGVLVDKPGNIVGYSLFQGCTKLNRVNFITPVAEIRGSAFYNIAPDAELYMPLAVPDVFAAQAIGNKIGGVYPRVYLQGNCEEWLAKMEENHYVVRKDKFNTWSGEYDGRTRTWGDVAKMMESDNEMCTVVDNKVTLNQGVRGVLAFVLRRHNGQSINDLWGFWVLKIPEKGLKVIVR